MRYLTLLLLLLSGCATSPRLADSPAPTRRAYEHRQRLHERERARLRDQRAYRRNWLDQ